MSEPDQKREHQALRQHAIIDVLSTSKGRDIAEIIKDLEQAIAARGLPEQPTMWMEAVARDASVGHMYVVSDEALEDVGVAPPQPEAP